MEKKLEESIQRSGNNLHLTVVKELEEDGWHVEVSPYFYDDTTDKPREIDIVAKKTEKYLKGSHVPAHDVTINLFIECKYFSEEVAFRMSDTDREKKKQGILIENLNKEEIIEDSSFGENSHILRPTKVGILYDTYKDNQKNVFDSITQPIKSYLFFKENIHNKGVSYLLTVFDGIPGIYAVIDNNIKDLHSTQLATSAMVGVNYSYKERSGYFSHKYFIVEFVNKIEFSKFLQQIEVERKSIISACRFQEDARSRGGFSG